MNARSRAAPSLNRRILALAVPALGSLAIEPLYVLVDTAVVGRLGTAPLGGLALASTVLNTSFWICNFLSFGTTQRVAFLFGRRDERGAAAVGVQALWLAAGLAVVLSVAIVAAGTPLARALGGRGEVLAAASTYLRISAAGIPFVLVALAGNGYLRGVQDTRTPLWIAAGANVVNLVVELWLVFGLHLGVAGSAWSTVLAQGLAALAFAGVMIRAVRRTRAPLRPGRGELSRLVTAGRRLVVRTGALLTALVAATSLAARLGDDVLAGHQIALQVWTFLALVLDALAIAGQALTGAALGAGDAEHARAVGRRLLSIGFAAGAAIAVVVAAAASPLARLFTPDPAVLARATVGLMLVGAMQVPAAGVFVLDGVLIGASDNRFVQWAMLGALGVFAAAAATLRPLGLGIAGIWLALAAWMLARLAANWLRFAGRAWAREADGSPA